MEWQSWKDYRDDEDLHNGPPRRRDWLRNIYGEYGANLRCWWRGGHIFERGLCQDCFDREPTRVPQGKYPSYKLYKYLGAQQHMYSSFPGYIRDLFRLGRGTAPTEES